MAVTSDEKVNMQRTWMRLVSVLVLGVLGNTTATLWAEEPALNLIRPDQPTPLILLGDKESPAEKFAAQELKRYLQKITGVISRFFAGVVVKGVGCRQIWRNRLESISRSGGVS